MDAVTLTVDGMVGDRYILDIGLSGPSETQSELSLSTLTIDMAGDHGAFEATVERPTADPEARATVPYGTALGYVNIHSTLNATDTSGVTLQFAVDRDALPDGLEPEDVGVMRHADGEWTTEDVTHAVEGNSHTATVPDTEPVAIVALEPGSVDVVDSEVPADRVRLGHETTLRATVENPGEQPANRTLTVTMAGETVGERDVSLGPGETATVQIAFEPVNSGTVLLDGNEAGSITVFGDDGSERTADGETDTGVPGFGVVAAALALLVTALAVRAGRQ